MAAKLSHVIAFDDAPFSPAHRGDVATVGVVYAGHRLDGVLVTRVRRDGANATAALACAVFGSRHYRHLHLVMLQGIALAGFNVVGIQALSVQTRLPVLVVSRFRPDLQAVRRALITKVAGGARKWRLVQAAGQSECVAGLWVQRAGLTLEQAGAVIERFAVHGKLPEPLRVAHLIAGAIGGGESRHRP